MLDTNIQTLANDHATALQARGLQVAAIAGTPVAELVAYCRTGETACVTVMEDFNATVEGLADKVADFMRGYLDFARNTAKPALQSLQESVAETLKTTESDKVFNPFTGLDIVRIGAPDVLEDSDFLASVAHYNSGNDKVPNTAPKYGHRSNEQLIELCMTGNGPKSKDNAHAIMAILNQRQWIIDHKQSTCLPIPTTPEAVAWSEYAIMLENALGSADPIPEKPKNQTAEDIINYRRAGGGGG